MEGSSEIQSYDLTGTKRFIPRRMLTLDGVGKEFCRLAKRSLVAAIRKDVDVTQKPFEVGEFLDIGKRVPACSIIAVIRISPLVGQALFVVSAEAVGIFLNSLFGGTGSAGAKTSGVYTPIESRFIRIMVDKLLAEMSASWNYVLPVDISLVKTELNLQHTQIVSPTEIVVTTPFEIKIGNDTGYIYNFLPYPTIDPILSKLTARFTVKQDSAMGGPWKGKIEEHLNDCYASVTADIGSTTLSMSEVSNLSVGDVLMLNTCATDMLELKMGGKSKFMGRPGIHRGNRAFQVTSIIKE